MLGLRCVSWVLSPFGFGGWGFTSDPTSVDQGRGRGFEMSSLVDALVAWGAVGSFYVGVEVGFLGFWVLFWGLDFYL